MNGLMRFLIWVGLGFTALFVLMVGFIAASFLLLFGLLRAIFGTSEIKATSPPNSNPYKQAHTPTPSKNDGNVIDVTAREVPPPKNSSNTNN